MFNRVTVTKRRHSNEKSKIIFTFFFSPLPFEQWNKINRPLNRKKCGCVIHETVFRLHGKIQAQTSKTNKSKKSNPNRKFEKALARPLCVMLHATHFILCSTPMKWKFCFRLPLLTYENWIWFYFSSFKLKNHFQLLAMAHHWIECLGVHTVDNLMHFNDAIFTCRTT